MAISARRWRKFIVFSGTALILIPGAAMAQVGPVRLVIDQIIAGALDADAAAPAAPQSVAAAPDALDAIAGAIDPMTTGALAPADAGLAEVVSAFADAEGGAASGNPGGSAQFQSILANLAAGHPVDSYAAARGLANDTERRTLQWAAIQFGEGRIDHNSVLRFMADAPQFTNASLFRTRMETALVREDIPASEVIGILGGAMPNTIAAQIALASAYLADGQRERAARIAAEIWVNNFLDRDTETRVLDRLGDLLTREQHWARAVHLMMHDRATGVERLTQYLTPAQRSLAVARNAVSRNASNAKALLDSVDPSMTSHPVFLFSRAQRARQFELWNDAVDWLNRAEGSLPDAAEWWYERQALVRQLMGLSEYRLAYRAADGYRNGPEGRQVEAHFHAGWIAFHFLDDYAAARQHFDDMRQLSTLPDTVTQSNYWLGQSFEKLGDSAGAQAAYQRAAAFSTVYYGQLARAELGLPSVELRGLPAWQTSEASFEGRDVVQGIRLLGANGQKSMAVALLRQFAQQLTDPGELLLAARLAQHLDAHDVAIIIADTAERRGVPLDLFNFPRDGIPSGVDVAEVDLAAIYAVARQESRFRVDAVSSAGARGLMQLMPGTAEEVAQAVGVNYSPSRLVTDAAYNVLLGSTYLGTQLERYDGSLVLAAAAYNAGPGNANRWITANGDPRSSNVDPVVWVEMIPFQETRKYVQRVLGNYLVYRARMGDTTMSVTQALRSIGD